MRKLRYGSKHVLIQCVQKFHLPLCLTASQALAVRGAVQAKLPKIPNLFPLMQVSSSRYIASEDVLYRVRQKKRGAFVGLCCRIEPLDHRKLNSSCRQHSNLDHKLFPIEIGRLMHLLKKIFFVRPCMRVQGPRYNVLQEGPWENRGKNKTSMIFHISFL